MIRKDKTSKTLNSGMPRNPEFPDAKQQKELIHRISELSFGARGQEKELNVESKKE